MTYCVGLRLKHGLVFMSDTRTNAGVDNVSMFRKMFTWEVEGERVITLMTAGNLATTQAVVSLLEERSKAPEDRAPSILQAPTMFQVASLVGETLREAIKTATGDGPAAESTFGASIIVGGQIKGMEPRLFLVYPEGNFVEASDDTPFFQIGETKYGKPILLRAFHEDMSFQDAVKLLMVSFDSTIAANLSVAAPLDMRILKKDALKISYERRIEGDDPEFARISKSWDKALKKAFERLPDIDVMID